MMQDDPRTLLPLAVQYHQSGRLDQAANIYRQILANHPNHADTLHLLGVLTGQQGDRPAAIALIQQAIDIAPQAAAYHNNLGNLWKDLGQLDNAISAYQRATQIQAN